MFLDPDWLVRSNLFRHAFKICWAWDKFNGLILFWKTVILSFCAVDGTEGSLAQNVIHPDGVCYGIILCYGSRWKFPFLKFDKLTFPFLKFGNFLWILKLSGTHPPPLNPPMASYERRIEKLVTPIQLGATFNSRETLPASISPNVACVRVCALTISVARGKTWRNHFVAALCRLSEKLSQPARKCLRNRPKIR